MNVLFLEKKSKMTEEHTLVDNCVEGTVNKSGASSNQKPKVICYKIIIVISV